MNKRLIITCIVTVGVAIFTAMPAAADSFTFSTGNVTGPGGGLRTAARPRSRAWLVIRRPGIMTVRPADT